MEQKHNLLSNNLIDTHISFSFPSNSRSSTQTLLKPQQETQEREFLFCLMLRGGKHSEGNLPLVIGKSCPVILSHSLKWHTHSRTRRTLVYSHTLKLHWPVLRITPSLLPWRECRVNTRTDADRLWTSRLRASWPSWTDMVPESASCRHVCVRSWTLFGPPCLCPLSLSSPSAVFPLVNVWWFISLNVWCVFITGREGGRAGYDINPCSVNYTNSCVWVWSWAQTTN